MQQPKLLVFASGTATGGGSGFRNLVRATQRGTLDADIVGVVSQHSCGGVHRSAASLGVPFIYFQGPWDEAAYQRIVRESGAEYVALSGWLKRVSGLDPARTFNIHPGPLPRFGGAGMYGDRVHEAVLAAYQRGEIACTEVTMHFVTGEYDDGPVFFVQQVAIKDDDTVASLAARVNAVEHKIQPEITDLVVHGDISWDGEHPRSLHTRLGLLLHRELV